MLIYKRLRSGGRLATMTGVMESSQVSFKTFLRGSMSMKRDQGFSLLELLIVVAIILIIATIAIPSLLRSRQSAQESSAVAQLRTINTAEVTYLSSNGGSYGGVPELITQG